MVAVGRSSVSAVDAVERVEFETRRAVRVFEARHTIVVDVVVDRLAARELPKDAQNPRVLEQSMNLRSNSYYCLLNF